MGTSIYQQAVTAARRRQRSIAARRCRRARSSAASLSLSLLGRFTCRRRYAEDGGTCARMSIGRGAAACATSSPATCDDWAKEHRGLALCLGRRTCRDTRAPNHRVESCMTLLSFALLSATTACWLSMCWVGAAAGGRVVALGGVALLATLPK